MIFGRKKSFSRIGLRHILGIAILHHTLKTNNIIMSMFCPLSICADSGETKWTQHSSNSALTHRPLALQLGKESVDTLPSLQTFDQDINDLKLLPLERKKLM